MKMNPVYKREMRVSSRSVRLAVVLLLFNGSLALVALLNMYSTLAQVRLTAEVQYTSSLDLYLFVAVLEFALLLVIMPAITAGSISGERERQTLDLMLASRMEPWEIVIGKLAAAFSTMGLLIVSSFPILAMVFVYGGVTMRDVGVLLLSYVAAALFVGSLGLFSSALCRRTTTATVIAYGILGAVLFGSYGLNQFVHYMSGMRVDSYLASIGQGAGQASSGGFLYLLLANPASTFLMVSGRMTGWPEATVNVSSWFGSHGDSLVIRNWVGVSLALQIAAAALLIWASVKVVEKKRGR